MAYVWSAARPAEVATVQCLQGVIQRKSER